MHEFYGRKQPRNFCDKKKVNLFFSQNFFTEFLANKRIESFARLYKVLSLEIGIGTGENIIDLALRNPNEGFIGCDPYLRGHHNIFKELTLKKNKNLIHTNLTFKRLYGFLNKIKFQTIYLLFPDPWQKKKHKKRRLISIKFVDQVYDILNKNGQVFVATDCYEYFELIKTNFLKKQLFRENLIDSYTDNNIFLELIKTKYFFKAMKAGKKTSYSRFLKKIHK